MAKEFRRNAEFKSYVKAAKFFRDSSNFPESDSVFWNRFENAKVDIAALLISSEKSRLAATHLVVLLEEIISGLFGLASLGNKTIVPILLNALTRSVAKFEGETARAPELYTEWARKQFGIPALISRNREKSKENEEKLKSMHVGGDFPLSILPTGKRGKKWKYSNSANALAERLRFYIENNRMLYPAYKSFADAEKRQLPDWLEEAHKLPPFSLSSYRQWSNLAWRILKDVSPERHPSKHSYLEAKETKICNRLGHGGASAEDDKIHDTLAEAFEVIATGISASKRLKVAKARK